MRRLPALAAVLLVACAVLSADEEASNTPVVRTDEWGRCYARAVPSESYGQKGTTKVYAVRPGDDALVYSFAWYSNQMYLHCTLGRANEQIGLSVVRFGPWARGHYPSATDLALAFYFRGELVRQYSTLDIAGSTANAAISKSHYTVIDKVFGYRQQAGNFSTFEVLTIDGRRLVFDPTTGAILATEEAPE